MSIVLVISVIFALISVGLIFIAIHFDNAPLGLFGIFLIFLTFFIGFAICGNEIPVDKVKKEIKNYEIVKTSYSTIIDTDKGTKIFREKSYSDINRNNTKVLYIEKINSYNRIISNHIKVKRE